MEPGTDSSPYVPSQDAKDLHAKHIAQAWSDQQASTDAFDNNLLTFSSAALGLSIAFIKDIVPLENAEWLKTLYFSWAAFAGCISITIASFQIAVPGFADLCGCWFSVLVTRDCSNSRVCITERQSLQGEQSMENDNEAKEVISIQGVACQDGRSPVGVTPLQEGRTPVPITAQPSDMDKGRSPVSITTQPNDINSGRMPVFVTPLTPGQPAGPAETPATSPGTPPATGEKS